MRSVGWAVVVALVLVAGFGGRAADAGEQAAFNLGANAA
jgi:hypothetical protein